MSRKVQFILKIIVILGTWCIRLQSGMQSFLNITLPAETSLIKSLLDACHLLVTIDKWIGELLLDLNSRVIVVDDGYILPSII